MTTLFCRICGYEYEEPQWGPDGQCPLYEICPCCGVESGYEDYTPLSAHAYRKVWLTKGTNWFMPKYRPAEWDLLRQMSNIPQEFR